MAVSWRSEETMKNSVSIADVLSRALLLGLYCIVSVVLVPVPAWMGCVLLSIMLVLY
jgi:hypothetical protein